MKSSHTRSPGFKRLFAGVLAAVFCLPLGTICHEVIGHGLTGVVAGGRIEHIKVLGVLLWPAVRWDGLNARYGECNVEEIPSHSGELIMQLGGSLSTLLASVVALVLLRVRRWSFPARMGLLAIGVWWIDMLTYTLPTWGIRRSIFWGGRYAEPYEAAVALGVPGRAFQGGVVLVSILLAYLWFSMLLHKSTGSDRTSGHSYHPSSS